MKRLIFFLVLYLICVEQLNAQCAMCTKTAAGLNDNSAEALNNGIIYLAFIPLMLLGALAFAWYRYNKGKL